MTRPPAHRPRVGSRTRLLAALLAAGLIAAACGSGSGNGGGGGGGGGGSTSGPTGVVNISDEYGSSWTCQFNPYNSSDVAFGFGPVYEELVYVDGLQSGKATPWLASAFAWSNGNKTLTFTIRSGVKWSDGVAFSAKDVLYSFDLLKKYPALDLNSDWSVLSSVTMKGTNEIVANFKTAAVPYFYYIADETPIVPEHIWSKIKNPVTYLDPHPVGTGAFLMTNCTGQNIQYTANPHYWQPGEPHIKTVNFPAYLSNTPANNDLKTGQDQWGSQFIPSIKSFYIDANPRYFHYYFIPVANVSIFPNLTNPLLAIPAVRQAISYAIDRKRVSQIGEYGYEPPANQTGIVTPTYASWYDSGLAGQYGNAYAYDPHKAVSTLEAAGFTKVNGVFQKNGKPLAFTIINNGGYSDWVAAVDVIKSDLAAVGIEVTPDNLSQTTWNTDVLEGHFELAYDAETGGPGPYYEMRQWLYSPNSAPIGQSASSNWERYRSSTVDQLIDQYAATTSTSVQHQVIDSLEKVMLSQVPVIPVTEEVDWYQYDTEHLAGWVTPGNVYAAPAQYTAPDWGVVLLHLRATS